MVSDCTCRNLSFAELKDIARTEGLSLQQLKARTGCCTGCGLCEPYIRLMYRTGHAHFHVLDKKAADELMRSPAASFSLIVEPDPRL